MTAGKTLEILYNLHNVICVRSVRCCEFFIFFETDDTTKTLKKHGKVWKLRKEKKGIQKGPFRPLKSFLLI